MLLSMILMMSLTSGFGWAAARFSVTSTGAWLVVGGLGAMWGTPSCP